MVFTSSGDDTVVVDDGGVVVVVGVARATQLETRLESEWVNKLCKIYEIVYANLNYYVLCMFYHFFHCYFSGHL